MRYKVLACEVFFREICHLVAGTPSTCDLEFLPKGLHDLGAERMLARIQTSVDAVPESCSAVLLAYGLCNNGLAGLTARNAPLVIPKAHDCMTLFMGDRRKYRAYFDANPGTYYRTSGWIEHADSEGAGEINIQQKLGMSTQYDKLVEQYGEENARYIAETMGAWVQNYSRLTFIHMGLAQDDRFQEQARGEAAERGWTFDVLHGSLDLLQRLVDGKWNDDFLVVPPGQSVRACFNEDVIAANRP